MNKSLITTNRYLKNDELREKALSRNIETSSAVEGIWVKRNATTRRVYSKGISQKTAQIPQP